MATPAIRLDVLQAVNPSYALRITGLALATMSLRAMEQLSAQSDVALDLS